MRGLSFGECSNDKVFQYAENKDDLRDIGSTALVIVGEGQPAVGVDFMCGNYVSRQDKSSQRLTATDDSNRNGGFRPEAQKKRDHEKPRDGYFNAKAYPGGNVGSMPPSMPEPAFMKSNPARHKVRRKDHPDG